MDERIEKFFQYNADKDGITDFYHGHYYIQRLDKIKSLDKVQTADIAAFTEIEHLKRKIELLNLYRVELYNRFQEINSANYHLQIRIERQRRYYENKVFYYITMENIPDREDVAPREVLAETFQGKDRHNALKRFAELCKQYPHAEIIKKIEKSQWE